VDVGVPGGERGNVQTGGREGDRVSTISQPGCSTSVALATGRTEEEEEGTGLSQADGSPRFSRTALFYFFQTSPVGDMEIMWTLTVV